MAASLTLVACAGSGTRAALPDAPAPRAGEVRSASYVGEHGTRSYRLYVPGSYNGAANVPLLVMLHGCLQDSEDIARGTRMDALAEEQGFLVVYPEQPATANPQKCWNWFDPAHQERGSGEPALIAGITRQVVREYRIDFDRVYVAGISAGGAMALITAATHPDLYSAVASHSGIGYRVAQSTAEALQVMRAGTGQRTEAVNPVLEAMGERRRAVPLIVFQGGADPVVNPANAAQLVEQWVGAWGTTAGSATPTLTERQGEAGDYTYIVRTPTGGRSGEAPRLEFWTVEQLGHAWSGGSPEGTYTDPRGPDASREIVRFLLSHRR